MAQVCVLDKEIVESFKTFKSKKQETGSAFIMKVDMKKLLIVEDQVMEDITVEQVQEVLPGAVPRYIAFSYKYVHKDGRVSYPLVMIFYSPPQIKPDIAMVYSSSLQQLYTFLEIQKVFEARKPEDITEEWLKQKLSFYG